ncbi:unannotated protein [freshwater metagenome]|uniref:Unannotated protein n=1 Tax=freshwater metagenome TaxID=449393 RepID=A0A6J7RVQ0_9ZZZZ
MSLMPSGRARSGVTNRLMLVGQVRPIYRTGLKPPPAKFPKCSAATMRVTLRRVRAFGWVTLIGPKTICLPAKYYSTTLAPNRLAGLAAAAPPLSPLVKKSGPLVKPQLSTPKLRSILVTTLAMGKMITTTSTLSPARLRESSCLVMNTTGRTSLGERLI